MNETSGRSAGSGLARLALAIAAAFACPRAGADAGPPFLTNDPGTPGPGHWEINLAAAPTIERGLAAYQLPQLDANLGIGERLQLTFEIPYVRQMQDGAPTASGWGNAVLGTKWRFLDQGEGGWQLSSFPQFALPGTSAAQREGIAADGPRLFLPLEAAHGIGRFTLNVEAGYYAAWRGPAERTLGVVVGRPFGARLELDAELYQDHLMGTTPLVTTFDLGGRYRLGDAFVLLFMAGRGVSGDGPGQIQFVGYFGVQVLLADWGRALARRL